MERMSMEDKQDIIAYKDNRYSKSNYLISAKYSSSLLENKITAISLSKIQKKEYVEDNKGRIVCSMTAHELRRLIGSNGGSFYATLEPVARNMTSRVIGFSDPLKDGGVFDYISIIDRAKYEKGTFTIYYNADIKEYLSEFKANFTILELPTMLKFKNAYSFRLYELLSSKSYYRKGIPNNAKSQIFNIEFNLSELKLNIGVVNAELDVVRKELTKKKAPDYDKAVERSPEKKYNNWSAFRRRVLEPAIAEINEKTDMRVSFSSLKGGQGGKVYGVQFIVDLTRKNSSMNLKNDCIVEAIEPDAEKLMELVDEVADIIPVTLKPKEYKTILKTAEYKVELVQKAVRVMEKNGNIKDVVAFLIAAIKGEYEEPVVYSSNNKSKNDFNNFHQRDYDYEQLEMELLNQ